MTYKVEIIESTSREEFKTKLGEFYTANRVCECKLQRNVFYRGVGASEGYSGKKTDVSKIANGGIELEESFVAILVYASVCQP